MQIAGYKLKVIYFFNLLHGVPGESDQGSPYDDKQYCPSGPVWKISLNESDPSDLITFQSPLPWTSYPPLSTTVTFSIADLPGQTLGDAVGNTITLDTLVEREMVPTHNPNEWIAMSESDTHSTQ